jgi:hypothetical protein
MTTQHITPIVVVVLLFNSSAFCQQTSNRGTVRAAQSSNSPDQAHVAFIQGNARRYLASRLAAMTQSSKTESDLNALAILAQQPKRKSVATRRSTAAQTLPPVKRLATNDDIIKMSRAKVDESVILAFINAHESKFDVSADGIVSLQQAGVSRTVLTAMMNAGTPANRIAPAPTSIAGPTAAPAVRPKSVDLDRVAQPFVGLESKQGIQPLKQGAVHVADTKAKGESLSDVGKQAAAWGGATVLIQNTPVILGLPQFMAIPVLGVVTTVIGKFYKPKFTRIFGLKNPASEQLVPTKPRFLVMFAKVETENLDAFEPRLVKLVPVQGQWRLAFAQKVQKDEFELSDHIEEAMAAKVTRIDKGKFTIEPNTELAPGEYALVLRPTKKLPKLTEKAMKNGRMGDYQLATYLVDFSVQ